MTGFGPTLGIPIPFLFRLAGFGIGAIMFMWPVIAFGHDVVRSRQGQSDINSLTLPGAVVILSAVASFAAWGFWPQTLAQQILSLTSTPPDVVLLYAPGQLNLYNRGPEDLLLWGTKFNSGPTLIGQTSRVIPTNAFYYFLTDQLKWTGDGGETLAPFDVYLSDKADRRRYIAHFDLLLHANGSTIVRIDTQQLGVEERDWRRQ